MLSRQTLTLCFGICFVVVAVAFLWAAVFFVLMGWPLEQVRPWSIPALVWQYDMTGPRLVNLLASLAVALGAGAGLGVLAYVHRPRHYYGDARWAHPGEIRKSRLLDPGGLLLGRRGGRYLRNNEPLHVLVAAPTRSGKGVGIVIPNLLSWPDSVIVLDIKHENYQITSGFRDSAGQRTFLWSPADENGRSHRWNFLDAVRPDPAHRVSDLQQLAALLVPLPANSADSMWIHEARDLFLGIGLYVLETPEVPHTVGEIYRTLKTDADLGDVCQYLVENRGGELSPACVQALSNFAHKAEKERSGVKSTLTAELNLWSNPVIDAATAASDFDLRDLRREPMSIYVGVTLSQVNALARILNTFFQQVITVLTRELPGREEPHRVLLLVDEFASLGRMDVLANAIGFVAGYGLRLINIIQGLGQLDAIYGAAGREAITQNSALQVYYAANDDTTAKYISERLGNRTIKTASRTTATQGGAATRNVSYSKRELMTPDEVRRLGTEKAIVCKEAARPVLGRKIQYYRDPAFAKRVLPGVEVPKLDVVDLPPRSFREGEDRGGATPAAGPAVEAGVTGAVSAPPPAAAGGADTENGAGAQGEPRAAPGGVPGLLDRLDAIFDQENGRPPAAAS